MLDKLNVLQLGWQSDFGTANGTATKKLSRVSSFSLKPELETRALDQLRGTLVTHQTVLDHYASSATFESADTTFEEINYFLEMLFGTDASVTGTAAPYVRDYAAPTTAQPTPHFATLQFGQSGAVYQMQDASIASLTLSGTTNSGIQVGGSLIGGKVGASTLTSLSDSNTETRPTGCMSAVAVAAWDAADPGTSVLASSAFAWELSINSNREYRTYLGSCTPTAYSDDTWNGQLRLSLEYNTSTDDFVSAILAASNTILEKQIEIEYKTGTTGTERIVNIQFAGHTMQAPELFQSRNGVLSVDLVFDGVYNPTMSNWLKISTSSALAKV